MMFEVIEQMMLDDQMYEHLRYHVQQHQLKNSDEKTVIVDDDDEKY